MNTATRHLYLQLPAGTKLVLHRQLDTDEPRYTVELYNSILTCDGTWHVNAAKLPEEVKALRPESVETRRRTMFDTIDDAMVAVGKFLAHRLHRQLD